MTVFDEYIKFVDSQEKFGRRLDLTDQKSYLRKAIKEARAKLSDSMRGELSDQMCEIALFVSEVQNAQTIALYVSHNDEPSTYMLLDILKRRGKDVILPVLGTGFTRTWAPFVSVSDLHMPMQGRPLEPRRGNLGEDAIANADVILAPALAVDANGNRLGLGGGWYDRVLLKRNPSTKVFALVFDEEVFDSTSVDVGGKSAGMTEGGLTGASEGAIPKHKVYELPHEEHDIKVDGYITPTKIQRLLPHGL
ncbi:MAG: 5-formyltetrahydrofolate cyclo-ligase [Candidatus Ancillula sp.]|jgi:5-formyltetrahydrofolate cyclo-ligase|nr:5-formyltetrahydrofolate cyclo-ligase [Candidatus Ancillula sp.]